MVNTAGLTIEDKLKKAVIAPDKEPYKIPDNWCWTTLEYAAKWGSGGTPSRNNADYYTGNIPWIKSGELDDDFVYETQEHISDEAIKSSTAKLYPINTVIIAMYGATIGKVGIMGVKASTNQACANGVCGRNVYFKYLFYYAISQKEAFIQKGKGGAQPNISQEIIKKHEFPLPPLSEQYRIVERIESLFSKLDTVKEKVSEVIKNCEMRKTAILYKAFSGELTTKWREENGFRIDSWKTVKIGSLLDEIKYGTSEKSDYSYEGIPVVRIPNICDITLNFDDLKRLQRQEYSDSECLAENDILIVRSNGSKKLVGKCAIVPKINFKCTYASFLIRLRMNKSILPSYTVWYLTSEQAKNQLFNKTKSSAGINNISSKEICDIDIVVPSLPEQKAIVILLEDLMCNENKAIRYAEKVIDQIDIIKKEILTCAFRGELGTNDPNDGNAVELLKEILLGE